MSMTAARLSPVNVWNGVVFGADEQYVRVYRYVFEFESVICVCYSMYDWGRRLTLMHAMPNALQWRRWPCVRLCSLNVWNGVVLALLHKQQEVRL